jgi:O-antigen/teichoic acid export membrane protein
MSKEVFSSLKTAVKGTALLVTSSAVSLVLWFFIKILIIRNVTQAEYGIYSLALTVVAIAITLSTLGLFEGTARHISTARGEGSTEKIDGIIKSACQVIFFSGIVATAVLYLLSEVPSVKVFEMPMFKAAIAAIIYAKSVPL